MVHLSMIVTLQQSFHKNRPLANSISQCGSSLGYILGPLWTKYLLETFGWRGGFLLHAGLMFQTTVLATQFSTSRWPKSDTNGMKNTLMPMLKNVVDFSLLTNPTFLLFCIGHFFHKFCQSATWLVLPNQIVTCGGSLGEAALTVSIMGVALFVGRLFSGVIANVACVNRTAMFGITTALGSAAAMSMAVYNDYTWTMTLAVLHGLAYGKFK